MSRKGVSLGLVKALVSKATGADPAVIEQAVSDWLDDHPEATTTVADGSITEAKLASAIAAKINSISQLSDEIDGIDRDVTDLKSAIDHVADIVDDVTSPILDRQTGTTTSSKTINNTASVVDATASYYVVSYPVMAGDKLLVSGMASNYGYLYIYTDADDSTIYTSEQNGAGIKDYSNVYTVVPENAVNIIVSGNTGETHPAVKVDVIAGYSVDEVQDMNIRVTSLEGLTTEQTESTTLTSDDYTAHADYYIGSSGSESSSQLWRYIEYTIPSNATGFNVTATAGQNAPLWILEDASGTVLATSTYISSVSVASDSINLSTYPTATKLFVNDRKSTALSITCIYNALNIDGEKISIDDYSMGDAVKNASPLWGKVLCCAGDSITYGADMDDPGLANTSPITVYQSNDSGNFTQTVRNFRKTWNYQIAERNNMTLYNAGVSGSTMQDVTGHAGFSHADGRYTKLPDNLDYLLIWFGWNDYAYGTLGAITDSTNESFYGGYNVVLPYLINKYPYAKIGLIVPFGASAGIREAVRLLGNKWGVAVWDNYQGGTPLYFDKENSVGVDASIVTANRTKFQANGAHPNYKGHTQLADMIEAWLKGI